MLPRSAGVGLRKPKSAWTGRDIKGTMKSFSLYMSTKRPNKEMCLCSLVGSVILWQCTQRRLMSLIPFLSLYSSPSSRSLWYLVKGLTEDKNDKQWVKIESGIMYKNSQRPGKLLVTGECKCPTHLPEKPKGKHGDLQASLWSLGKLRSKSSWSPFPEEERCWEQWASLHWR